MKRLTGYFLEAYEKGPLTVATKTRHLFQVNVLFLLFYSALIPLNILTRDYLTAMLLPPCAAFTLLSLFLIRKRRHILASNISIFVCFVMISLDLFVSHESPGHNIIYRGGFTFMVFMIVITLISADRYISLKIGVSSLCVLFAVFAVRIYPLQAAVTPMDTAVMVNILMLFAVAAIMTMIIQNDSDRMIAALEREKQAVEEHSRGLEQVIQARTADLHQAVERLKEGEERYRSIVENSHDGIIIIDEHSRIVFANEEMYRITGYGRGDSANLSFLDFIGEDSRSEIAERHARRMRGEEVAPVYELTIIAKSGARIRCEARVSISADSAGGKRSVVMLQDITERKSSEQSLKIQHDLAVALSASVSQHAAFELIMDAVLEISNVDSGGIYVPDTAYGSMVLAVARGLSENFVASVSRLEHDTPQMKIILRGLPSYINYAEIVEKLKSVEASKRAPENLHALAVVPIMHHGTVIAALNCASHTADEFPESSRDLIESIAVQVGAVIGRLRSEEALRESERKYRQLVEKGNNIIFTIDDGGIITYVSPSISDLLEFTAGEMTGRPFAEFIYGEDLHYIISKFQELEKGILSPDEYRIITKSGGIRWIISNSQPIIEDGRFQGIIGVFTDITWRKQAEEERLAMERKLLHAQKLESLGVLAGGIAHDFNNLLMAMMGNLELASLHMSGDSPAASFVDEAARASHRAADLVKQMLAYSGGGSRQTVEVDLRDLVDEITHLLRTSISKKAALEMHLSCPVSPVIADPTQVQQIAMNLIVNSSEALGTSAGTITVTTGEMECDDEYLRASYLQEKPAAGRYAFLEVADTGCGMDEATISRLFDPFFSTKFAGRGLGMAAVLGIVRSHHGAIIVQSARGEGSTVRVLFPAAAEGAVPVRSSALVPGPSPLKTHTSGTVLIVDDDEMILATAAAMTRRLGFTALVAGDGRRALDIFRERCDGIDCAIIDLTMPGLGGREVIAEMKKIRPGARTILTSGYLRDDVMKPGESGHADGFIQKPYRLETLDEELRLVLQRQQGG